MTLDIPNLNSLLIRVFAKSLSFYSGLRLRSEEARLQFLLDCLPPPKSPLQSIVLRQQQNVLIVIPFRDKWELTNKCIASLANQQVEDQKIKVVLVNNNSTERETLEKLPIWQSQLGSSGIESEVLDDPAPFNFSGLNNRAVSKATMNFEADLLLFLNNDVEFTSSNQLEVWVNWHVNQADVGISGVTLLYPNRTIQHACVLPGFKIVATHPLRNCSETVANEWSNTARCVPAVTGAALMIRSSLFQQLGGFNPQLAHACQDVDLCLKSLQAGYENWVAPHVQLIHHESATRKADHKPKEVEYFYERWEREVEQLCGVSRRLSRWTEPPCISLGEGSFPWRRFQK